MKKLFLIFTILVWSSAALESARAEGSDDQIGITRQVILRLTNNNDTLKRVVAKLEAAINGGAGDSSADSAGSGKANAPMSAEDKVKQLKKDELRELQDNAAAMKSKEQSDANKMIGGLSMAGTGIGGMMLAQGLSEKAADKEGAADIAAYQETFRCGISGQAHNVKYGEEGFIPAPDLMQTRTDFATLALKVKDIKTELGIRAGIESEYDIARIGNIGQISSDTDGLYANESAGKTASRFSTAQERLDSGDADSKIKTGAIIAGAGVLVGVAGNLIANRNNPEQSDEIKDKYSREIEDYIAKLKADLAGINLPPAENVPDTPPTEGDDG